MRNREALKILLVCLIIPVFIKYTVAKPLCSNGLYQHWDSETNKLWCCREVLVKRGFEAVPCTEIGGEDGVKKCPIGQYQPDETFSSNTPQCMAEPQCTDEGIRKDSKCISDYCWTVCVCNLEVAKCGLNPLYCTDAKESNCLGKVLQDCSCAPPDITSTLLISPPTRSNFSTILKPINPDLTAESSSPASTHKLWTETTKTADKIDITKDGSDIGAKGNELHEYRLKIVLPTIIISIFLVLVASYIRVHFRKQCHNRLKGGCCKILGSEQTDPDGNNELDIKQGSEQTDPDGNNELDTEQGSEQTDPDGNNELDIKQGSEQTDPDGNNGLNTEQPSEADDSGVSVLSQGSDENGLITESGSEPDDPYVTHTKSTSISYPGTKLDHTGGNDSDHGTDPDPNPRSCQFEMQKSSEHREKPILVEEQEDGCRESDPLLMANECADDPSVSELSQGSDDNCDLVEANPDGKNLSNRLDPESGSELDDADVTHLKSTSISYSGTKMDDMGGNESDPGTDPDPSPSLYQLEVQKGSNQRDNSTLVEKEEDDCIESDLLLGLDDVSDLSQRSDDNCDSREANPDRNNLDPESGSEPDDPDVTHPKSTSISYSGTKMDDTGGSGSDPGTDPDPSPSLYQLEVQKGSNQRENPALVEKEEDDCIESDPLLGLETSLQVKRVPVAVVNPFRKEVQTFPVQDSPPAQNAETQPLRGEGHLSDPGFSYGGAAANLLMNWNSFGSSINHESTN